MLRVRASINVFDGGPGLATFYFETPLEDVPAATRVAAVVHTAIAAAYAALAPNNVSYDIQPDVDVVTAASGLVTNVLTIPTPAPLVGTAGVDQAPQEVAMLLRLSTGTFIRGRRLVGRVYVSPLESASIAGNGRPDAGSVATLNGIYAYATSLLASGDLWVVWHRPKAGVGGSVAPIIAASAGEKFAVLKSRRD